MCQCVGDCCVAVVTHDPLQNGFTLFIVALLHSIVSFKYDVLMVLNNHHRIIIIILNPQSNAISATINIVKPFQQYSEAIGGAASWLSTLECASVLHQI